jgi:hypothetical protein
LQTLANAVKTMEDDGGLLLESLTLQLASKPSIESVLDEHLTMHTIAQLKMKKAAILTSNHRIHEAIKELMPLVPISQILDESFSLIALLLLLDNLMQLKQLDECEPLILLLESILLDQPQDESLSHKPSIGQGLGGPRGLISLYSTRLMLLKKDESRAAMELAKWLAACAKDDVKEGRFLPKEDVQANLLFISAMMSNAQVSLPTHARVAAAELFLLLGLTDSARSILVDLCVANTGSGTDQNLLANNLAVARAVGGQLDLAREAFMQANSDDYSLACTLLWKGLHSEAVSVLSSDGSLLHHQEGHQLFLLRLAEALVGLYKEQATKGKAEDNRSEDPLLLLFRALDCLQRFLQQELASTWPDRERIRQHALALISYVHLMLGDPASSLAAGEQGIGERSDQHILQSLCVYSASSLDSLGRPFESIDVLKDAASRSKSSKEVTVGLAAMTAREQGNGVEALRILRGIKEACDDSALLASYLLMAEGRPQESMAELRKFKA